MDKDGLPHYSTIEHDQRRPPRRHLGRPRLLRLAVKLFIVLCIGYLIFYHRAERTVPRLSTRRLRSNYATCSRLHNVPQDPNGDREANARHVPGQPAVLIKNATVWTGEAAPSTSLENIRKGKGFSWIQADVLLDRGLIVRVDYSIPQEDLPANTTVYHAHGRQLTAGIVDMHSHAGVGSLPDLRGSNDDNEISGDVTPYVRSLDAINPLDHQIQVIKSGGVTTSLILPGSGNNMGGEAFVVKHAVGHGDGRPELSAEDMLADPTHAWRYMKMACGENPKRVYAGGKGGHGPGPYSRMGEAWFFRHALEQATKLVQAQDDWCAAAASSGPENMADYLPEDLQWESLGALLRGQVMLNTHCYTVPDLEAFVRHTNEFNFTVRAFHHAHQTYLVPELLKRAYGGRPPAAALFADNMYYKAEAYVGSEQAGPLLNDNGIDVVYVSDNPVINAQHVVFEAAKAYRNGLPYAVALAGVTSKSAELLGLGERIGKVKPGFDADVVVWDSDPLSAGATPVQVWIDGIPQFAEPFELDKAVASPIEPDVDFELHAELEEKEYTDVVFTNITHIHHPSYANTSISPEAPLNLVIRSGRIACLGECSSEAKDLPTFILKSGHLNNPITAFGSNLGLVEIDAEGSTTDGVNTLSTFSRAVDGLVFDTKSLQSAYSHGVTRAIVAPLFDSAESGGVDEGGFRGVSTLFHTRAKSLLEPGAVIQEEVAVHWSIGKGVVSGGKASVSASVGHLRKQLLKATSKSSSKTDDDETEEQHYLRLAVAGKLPFVLSTHSADLVATVLQLIRSHSELSNIHLVIHGGGSISQIAHLLASIPNTADQEHPSAKVSVILAPLQNYRVSWPERHALTGAPLTNGSNIDALLAASSTTTANPASAQGGGEKGIGIGIGVHETWQIRDLSLDAGIVLANSFPLLSGNTREEKRGVAEDMVGRGLERLLEIIPEDGRNEDGEARDDGQSVGWVVSEGDWLGTSGRVVAVGDGLIGRGCSVFL